MPITSGHGNPDWSYEETILALDLFYRHAKPVAATHPDAAELSRLLRSARIHPDHKKRDNFRNADGIALKTQNLDSAINGGALSNSKTDRLVAERYPISRLAEIQVIAASIRSAIKNPLEDDFSVVPEDEIFVEGRFLTARAQV